MATPPAERLASLALAQRTGYLLIKLGEVTLELAEQALKPLGLRARHFNVMAMIAAEPTLSQRDISDLLGLDPNIILALVDDLERQRLVTRQRSTEDRRRYILTLTASGQRVLTHANQRIDTAEHELLTPLNAKEAKTLRELAHRTLTPHWPPHASVTAEGA